MTKLTQGNKALRDKDYQQAIACYIEVLMANPEISKAIVPNITMAQQKFTVSRKENKGKQRVAVCGWALSHHAERICTLAKLYEAFAEVEIIGALFPTSGTKVSESIRDIAIPIHSFVVDDEGLFLEQALKLVLEHPFDVVHLSQPKMPNIFFGILYKLIWNARVLVDIDDEEIATEPAISLDAYISEKGSLPELKALEGVDWTRLALGLVDEFDGVVHHEKNKKYSPELITILQEALDNARQPISQKIISSLMSFYLFRELFCLTGLNVEKELPATFDFKEEINFIKETGAFDTEYYRLKNPDIVKSKLDPVEHYCKFGWKESRNPSVDFNTVGYLQANSDVLNAKLNPFFHYLNFGIKENRRLSKDPYNHYITDNRTQYFFEHGTYVKNNIAPTNLSLKIAVVAHVYFIDIANELLVYIKNIPIPCNVFITTINEKIKKEISCIFNNYDNGEINIKVIPNRGRDIGALINVFHDLRGYDLVCKIHTKKSFDSSINDLGNRWRNYLLENLLGSQHLVYFILKTFEDNPRLGVMFPPAFPEIYPYTNWGNNYKIALALYKNRRIDISIKENDNKFDFPVGNMFWFRPTAIEGLFSYLTIDMFEEEPIPTDGTLAHAVERVILLESKINGFSYKKIINSKLINSSQEYNFFEKKLTSLLWYKINTSLYYYDSLVWNKSSEEKQFPKVSTPKVSIIIPVYNQVDYTYRCLTSIKNNIHDIAYEIIVIDDCSNDKTQQMLTSYDNLKVVFNNNNLGFVGSCNRGLEIARGEYIVFLNNDTIILDGWLEELINTFEAIPNVGLVGSMLLYPDGSLQEAGGIIWSDGSGLNYGRNDNPNKPIYNYLRDVDYCSGASIMLKHELLKKLNGFDTAFSPGYYEDTDLAFRVRKEGYRVLFQPASKLLHYEGKTSGTDLTKGMKRYQVINRKKFLNKWNHELKKHNKPHDGKIDYLNRRTHEKILIIGDVTPTPDKDSGSNDFYLMMRILLEERYSVTFMPAVEFKHIGRYTYDLQNMGVECIYNEGVESPASYIKENGKKFKCFIVIKYNIMARYIDLIKKSSIMGKIIFDTVDLHYIRESRAALLNEDYKEIERTKLVKNLELKMVSQAHLTLVRSSYEKEILAKECPESNVMILPICRNIPGCNNDFNKRKDIVFIGGFLHKPNIDAVRYFIKEIWPLIANKLKNVKFIIVGSHIEKLDIDDLCSDKNIIKHGFAPNLLDILDNCLFTVAPLRYGAGMKGKIVSSMCSGVPCIATSIATEGGGFQHKKNILVGDSPEEFSELCYYLYNNKDLWTRISRNSLEFANNNLSINRMKEVMLDAILL